MFRVYTWKNEQGVAFSSWLYQKQQKLFLQENNAEKEARRFLLSPKILLAVFARYAKPIEQSQELLFVEDPFSFMFSEKQITLKHFSFLQFGDVYPTDYLLLKEESKEPVAAPAPLIHSALFALLGARKVSR